MKHPNMDDKQYKELTHLISNLSTEVTKLSNSVDGLDAKVSSISTWINGDPQFKSSVGTDEKIQRLEERVENNQKELERVRRIDEIELKVDDHQKRLDRIYTAIAVVSVIASIIGFLIGVFAPPFIG